MSCTHFSGGSSNFLLPVINEKHMQKDNYISLWFHSTANPMTTILTTTELIGDTHNHFLFNFFIILVYTNAVNTLLLLLFIVIYTPTNQKVRGSNPLQRAKEKTSAKPLKHMGLWMFFCWPLMGIKTYRFLTTYLSFLTTCSNLLMLKF